MIYMADISGERLDAFLARRAEGLSRSAVQKLIEDGQVKRGPNETDSYFESYKKKEIFLQYDKTLQHTYFFAGVGMSLSLRLLQSIQHNRIE